LANARTFFVHSSDQSFGAMPPFRSFTVAVDRATGVAGIFRDVIADEYASPWAADDDNVYYATTNWIFTIAADGNPAPSLDIRLSSNGGFVRDGASLYVVDGSTSGSVPVDGGFAPRLVADGRLLRYPLAGGGAPEV